MEENNIIKLQSVNPDTLEFQEYQVSDETLISSFELENIVFSPNSNSIEYCVFDANKNLIHIDYNFRLYSMLDNGISINPKQDLIAQDLQEGQYYSLYSFLSPLLNSNPFKKYFISEISSDRTELRLKSNNINKDEIKSGYENFISSQVDLNYFRDFYLNFGNNQSIIANNILIDESNSDDISILIKLYEPLSSQFDIKNELWVVDKLSDSIAYFLESIVTFSSQEDIIPLKGPNLNISIQDRINNSTSYTNYNSLQTSVSSSLTNQLNNILLNKSIRLNIDYSDYSNFIHFSSAQTRLENFYYKLSLIEQYNLNYISSSLSVNNYYITSSQNIWLDKIKEIQEGFDGYEYHLYYNSGSTSWPKSNSTKPYVNYVTTSSQGSNWLTGQLSTASLYDSENKDILINAIPSYLREDSNNAPYELFVEMLGQHFDTLYLYYGEITNKYNSDNRINYGSSKDLISDILKDFGVKIYQNNFSTNDLYSSFLGITSNLNLLPPTGSELITSYITASNEIIPLEDVNSETYKRIYHNLPLLLKKKGTVEGLRLLINLYGIPDTILRINEFGGKNRNDSNDWDQFQNQFNYAFFTTSSGYVKFPFYDSPFFDPLTNNLVPQTIEFRFKTTGIPSTSSYQILLTSEGGGPPTSYFYLTLEYTGSGYNSGSYSGSVYNPYYEYGTLKIIDSNLNSSSIYLPFFDGEWWSIMITNEYSPFAATFSYNLYAKNKIYNGYDGNKIGFQSSSILSNSNFWYNPGGATAELFLSYRTSQSIAGRTFYPFSGSFQELRYYNLVLSESIFNDYVMNPYSIESNQLIGDQSTFNSLMFRAPLGSVLDNNSSTARSSSHPSLYVFSPTQSTSIGSVYSLSSSYSFVPNREIIYFDQFPAGIKNAINDKIQIENNILPSGDVLSSKISIQQFYPISESYTKDVNYLEVAFSPQNEINDDIISQLGYFNIGDYIGDPRQLTNSTASFYPNFNQLRDDYFKKYQNSYNLVDFVRLIKYFDNSLFKLIKDFIPARTSLASGIIIKQHLLERNRYSPAQVSYITQDYSASVKSFPFGYTGSHTIYKFSGGNGGSMPELKGLISSSLDYPNVVNITQSWEEEFVGPKGRSYVSHSVQEEFFNGEFKGSKLEIINNVLNEGGTSFDNINSYRYTPILYRADITTESDFLNTLTYPNRGEIFIFIGSNTITNLIIPPTA